MEDLYINNSTFGKCKVICFEKNIALIELPCKHQNYAVTIGLSAKTNTWERGFFYKTYNAAVDIYNFLVDEW